MDPGSNGTLKDCCPLPTSGFQGPCSFSAGYRLCMAYYVLSLWDLYRTYKGTAIYWYIHRAARLLSLSHPICHHRLLKEKSSAACMYIQLSDVIVMLLLNVCCGTRSHKGVSNEVPHTTYRLPLGTPLWLLVYGWCVSCVSTCFFNTSGTAGA